jgi:hypothetical protein
MFTVTLHLADSTTLDLTPYVRRLQVKLGIHEARHGTASSGMCRAQLDNQDRRFSPDNVDSPYYGLLQPNQRVEVRIDDAPIFVGFVRRVSVESGQYGERTATLEIEDLLSLLQSANISLPLQEDKRADQLIRAIIARAFRTSVARGEVGYKLNDATQVAENDTVTIDGITYRFKATPAQINDVKRTAPDDRIGQMKALKAAINGEAGEGTLYYAGTQRSPNVVAELRQSTLSVFLRAWNPLRYYRFDETSGSVVHDLGENKQNASYANSPTLGVTQSPVYAEEPRTCVTLDGISQYISFVPLDVGQRSFAFHIMFRAHTSPPTAQSIISSIGDTFFSTFHARLYDSGSLQLVLGTINYYTAAGSFTFGNWHRLVVAYNHRSGRLKVWRYETELLDAPSSGVPEGRQHTLHVGAGYWYGEPFKGDMAEFAFYYRDDFEGFFFDTATPPTLNLVARSNGAWANGIQVSTTSAALQTINLTSGADPSDLDLETGIERFDIAGDEWKEDSTSALSAIQQVVESERGMFWQARDGTLVFKNRYYRNSRTFAAPVATSDDHHHSHDGSYGMDDIYNRVVVRYTPRRTLAQGVVAKMNTAIRAAGRWGNRQSPPETTHTLDRFSVTQNLPPSGITTVNVPFVDIERGRITAAKNLRLPPEPNVDYTANTKEDGTGEDYTVHPLHPDVLRFAVASTASNIEVTVTNTALGMLFIRDFQLRGQAVVAYEPVEYVREDKASIEKYGVRTLTVDLPLTGSQYFAESLAEYLIGRHLAPHYRIRHLTFRNQSHIGTTPILNVEIGDVIAVTDYQLGVTGVKYLVTGLQYEVRADLTMDVTVSVQPLQDVTFWILGDAAYGVLDSTTRLGV